MSIQALFSSAAPVLSLAPMQDVTDLPFWRLMARYGGADLYFTEFFRVTPHYSPEKSILRSITENPTGRPAVAQIIGNDLEAMARTAKALEKHPVAAVDLNLGCPAPVVYRKCAGGGLLRDLPRVDELLGVLRAAITGSFTVKTRLGFSDPSEFDALLEVFSKHKLDLLTVHGRTVAEKYGPHVHLDCIAKAVRYLSFPVQANGNVTSAESAVETLRATGAAGLMIGRGAIPPQTGTDSHHQETSGKTQGRSSRCRCCTGRCTTNNCCRREHGRPYRCQGSAESLWRGRRGCPDCH